MAATGTYVGMRLTPQCNLAVSMWMYHQAIASPILSKDLHITVANSSRPFLALHRECSPLSQRFQYPKHYFHCQSYKDKPLRVCRNTFSIQVWPSWSKQVRIVLAMDSYAILQRHIAAVKCGAISDFEFVPHITLTKEIDCFTIPWHIKKPAFDLEILEEFTEEQQQPKSSGKAKLIDPSPLRQMYGVDPGEFWSARIWYK